MDAPCDMVLILDCCDTGLASVVDTSATTPGTQERRSKYRKELLGACTWGNEAVGRMSLVMCDVLMENANYPHPGMSVSTLARQMNNLLGE